MNWPDDYINKIIVGDCLEVMKDIPDGAVDCVITSPPYDNLRTYGKDIDKTWNDAVWPRLLQRTP